MDVNQAKQEHLLALKGILSSLHQQIVHDSQRCVRNIKEAKNLFVHRLLSYVQSAATGSDAYIYSRKL